MAKSKKLSSFDRIVQEARRAQHKKPKTLGEAREARTKQLSAKLLKQKITAQNDKIEEGNSTRAYVRVLLVECHCKLCQAVTQQVRDIEVYSKVNTTDGSIRYEFNTKAMTPGMYGFHSDLPMVVTTKREFPPICAECIDTERSVRKVFQP